MSNAATVTSNELPPVSSDDPGTAASGDPTLTAVRAAPVLGASKSASLLRDADGNGTVSPGDTLVYQIRVVNSGNQAATGVIFTDTPDANSPVVNGFVFTSQGTIVQGNSSGDSACACDLGTIPGGGGTATVSFRVRITRRCPRA